MRELKFRAWDLKVMITMPLNTNYGLSRFFGILSDDAKIMQFTGLCDKSGKEIYEGDLLKCNQWKQHIISAVKWYDKNSQFAMKSNDTDYFCWENFSEWVFNGSMLGNFKIIGNIHEDKHLLEESK